jgi:hypothetical protein
LPGERIRTTGWFLNLERNNMNRIFSFASAILLIMVSFHSVAQTSFTADPVKFPEQVENYLGQYDKKEAKKFIEEFKPVWTGIPDNVKTSVYGVANMLSGKMVKPYPEFWGFMMGVKTLAAQNQLTSIYPSWISVINKTSEAKDKKQLPEFLAFSYHFYLENSIYVTSSSKWVCTGNNYSYTYETNNPVVTFTKTDLKCYSKNDSSVISNTSGTLLPLKEKFIGKGGVVTWERAGLPKNETYAELKKYDVSLRSVGFDADSVTFHTTYFKTTLSGRLNDKIVSTKGGVSYPQFQSYSKKLFIKDIFKDIDYDGGFSMQGASLQGFGSSSEQARLRCYRNNKVILAAFSQLFTIKPESIDAEKASINVYIDKDSISHPYLRFRYQNNGKVFTLSRDKTGLSQSPFYNTYHKLEMYFEALTWKMEDPFMEFGAAIKGNRQETPGRFESSNYFSQKFFTTLRGMDAVHPMIPIEELSRRQDTTLLKLSEVASFMGRPTEQILPVIGSLSNGGFITYDPQEETILIKRKLFDYLKAAGKQIDYDPIEILSEVTGPTNATFNILNYELLIQGVKRVNLSDSQFVRIYPDKQELIVLKNRDMRFAGDILAGSTEYYGSQFFFNYDEYKIDLIKCDSLILRVFPFEKTAEKGQVKVKSVIRNVKGHIVIDGKDNKSGVKKGFHNYPILTSTTHTYVFYNDKSIYKGVYDSTKFYFKVDPFIMDSLDNFRGKTQRFPGEFRSAGIIPVIREELGVMKDYSLGFVRKLPASGISLYGDKAVFNNEIRLSNAGLQADGSIKFLTSTADSKAFTLFPDSLRGIAEKYINVSSTTKPEVPLVKGSQVLVRYHPNQKVMFATSTDSLLHLIEDCNMRGTTELRPEGMTGKGRIYFQNAEVSSRNFKFKAKIIDADTAAFKLKSQDDKTSNAVAFKTDNVNAHIDFTKRYGEFKSNGEETFVEFPENQYICFMDRFKWFMDNENIELEKNKKSGDISIDTDLDLAGSNFYSIHPEQDSLNFMAPKAVYDLRKKVITCNKVEFLNIADARIYPDSNRVIIHKKADMEEFKNSKIIANSVTKYHTIYNAKVKITAKRKYVAEGDYSYMDENKKEQIIHFANITLDSTLQTYAKGEIKESEKFMLSLHFEYKGKVELKAADIGLNFTGGVRLVEACEGIASRWFKFKGVVDPNNIQIPVEDILEDYEGGVLGAGIALNSDSISLYPSFLSQKLKQTHPDIVSAKGFLIFDKKMQEYQIAAEDKLKERNLPGNFVAFSKEKCMISGDGKLSFGNNTGQMKITPIGTLTHDIKTGKTMMKVAIMLDFPFLESALEKVADKINNYPDLTAFDYTKSNYEKALRELVGLEKSDKVVSDLSIHGEVKRFPSELDKAIFLSDVTMKWDPLESHWISDGTIGVSNIYKKQVYKYIGARLRIKKGRQFDEVEFVIKLDDQNWYVFHYSREIMDVASSDKSFEEAIAGTKDDKRKYKGEKGIPDYEFRYSSSKRSKVGSIFIFE